MSYASSRAWALKETSGLPPELQPLLARDLPVGACAFHSALHLDDLLRARRAHQADSDFRRNHRLHEVGTDMEKLSKAVAEIETIERVSLVPQGRGHPKPE